MHKIKARPAAAQHRRILISQQSSFGMATWLLRNPIRLEILHLIQQHNKLNPAPSQQILLHLSPEEDFRLRILETEQKVRKRNFNPVQRSAYALRRCIEEVLRYNASTSTATYDREGCIAAMRDFLEKLEAEVDIMESLKMAVKRAKILETEESESERKKNGLRESGSTKENLNENKPSAEAESPIKVKEANTCNVSREERTSKSKSAIVVKVSKMKWDNRLCTMAPDQETLRAYKGSKISARAETISNCELRVKERNEMNFTQASQKPKSSQDTPKVLEQSTSVDIPLPMDEQPEITTTSQPKKIIKGILKVRLSVDNLSQVPEKSRELSPQPTERNLHPILDHEEFGIERGRQTAKSLRKAHERGLELYSEVKRLNWEGAQSEIEV